METAKTRKEKDENSGMARALEHYKNVETKQKRKRINFKRNNRNKCYRGSFMEVR